MVCVAHKREGDFEPRSVSAWISAIRPGMVAFDVGAYSGLYAILAALKGARAVAVEPNRVMVERIRQNVKRNQVEVDVLPFAAGAQQGTAKLSSKFATSSASHISDTGETVAVMPIVSADPVCAVKIDVEGYELQVLVGMTEIIQRDKPLIIAEALSDRMAGLLETMLFAYGYKSESADKRNLIFRCGSAQS